MVDIVDMLNSLLVTFFDVFNSFGQVIFICVIIFAGIAVAIALLRYAAQDARNIY